jgi:hypothetical protein
MATLSSRRASLGSVGASWAFFRGGIGRRRPTGGGGVLGETGCKGIDTLEEREALLLPTGWGLVPILPRKAASSRKGRRVKQKQGAPDAGASCLVRRSLSHNGWRVSRHISGERHG